MEKFDCIIIGTGAAGVSAALTLKLLKRNFLLIGSKNLSYKIGAAEKIKNYPGFLAPSGSQLKSAFLSQLASEGIEICEQRVNGVYPADGGYSVACGEQSYESKTVIVATGVESVKQVSGEREFLGRGVSYCATCDGFLYRGKTIAAIVEGGEQTGEVRLLAKYAQKVYLFCSGGEIDAGVQNVEFVGGKVAAIAGGARVEEVKVAAEDGGRTLKVDGVFVLKNSVAADCIVYGLKSDGGAVTVGRDLSTNLAGVFAAGDVTGRPYQYAKAVGEGNVAAHSVNAYLNKTG